MVEKKATPAAADTPKEQQPQKPAKKEKKIPEGLVIPPKKPQLSKAERRALQEQQRAAKASAASSGVSGANKPPKPQTVPERKVTTSTTTTSGGSARNLIPRAGSTASASVTTQHHRSDSKADVTATGNKSQNATSTVVIIEPTFSLVSHLPAFQDVATKFHLGATIKPVVNSFNNLHPLVWRLGYQYASGEIRGGNARCRAMLECFASVLKDYIPRTDSTIDIRQSIDHDILKPSFNFWTEYCRPHSVSMGNAFAFVKTVVAALPRDQSYDDLVEDLVDAMQAYVRERIDYADKAIANLAFQKLSGTSSSKSGDNNDDESILVYGNSQAIRVILQHAHNHGKQLNVLVADSEPLYEGKQLITWLRQHCPSISCTYFHLSSLTYVLHNRVGMVLLGASALLSDGSVFGRVGTAVVTLAAYQQHIPVLVCAETYKISHRVQLEGLTHNELGPIDATSNDKNDSSLPVGGSTVVDNKCALHNLPLLYDWTPASLISGIITELGLVPPSSVAVLLREMNQIYKK